MRAQAFALGRNLVFASGAYRPGQNDELDRAMAALPAIHEFVQQVEGDQVDAATTRARLLDLERSMAEWTSGHEEAASG